MRQYLNLPEILSQAWLDQTVIFLALATLKVYFFSRALIAAIFTLGDASLPLCRRLELLAGEIENAPANISKITNPLLDVMAQNVHTLVEKMIYLSGAIARGLISLLIELYLGTLTCLITAMVKGTLELVSSILADITQFVQNAINAVLKEFNSALSGLSSVINGVSSAVSAVESLFTSSDKSEVSSGINKVNLTISSLSNITIPTTWISEIEDLADEVPDFEDVLSNVTSLITSPITHFTQSYANASFNFTLPNAFVPVNSSELMVLPDFEATIIRQQATLNSTESICDDAEAIFAKAAVETQSISDYIILGLCIGTVLYAVFNWVLAYLHQRKKTRLFSAISELNNPVDIGNSISIYEHGFMAIFTRKWAPQTQWLFSYISTPNLRTCLFLGLLGWFIVLLQFITLQQASKILRQIQENGAASPQTQAKLAQEFATYLDESQNSLNLTVSEINDVMFSSLHNTTAVLLDRIDFFQDRVNNTINTVFGSSFLAKPLRTIIYCTIGRKIDTIEAGLQWIEDNTEISAPVIDKVTMEQAFGKSSPDVTELSSEITSSIIPAVEKIIMAQKKALWTEFYIATALVGIWGVYLVIGLTLISFRKPQVNAAENRLSTQAISWPSQLREEAQQEYSYPYNDPYGVPYIKKYDTQDSVVSKPQAAYSGNTSTRVFREVDIPEVTGTSEINEVTQSTPQPR